MPVTREQNRGRIHLLSQKERDELYRLCRKARVTPMSDAAIIAKGLHGYGCGLQAAADYAEQWCPDSGLGKAILRLRRMRP